MNPRMPRIIIAFAFLAASRSAGYGQGPLFVDSLSAKGTLQIARRPPEADYSYIPGRAETTSLPKYDPDSGRVWQVDLRSMDVSGFKLSGRLKDLQYASFDSKTIWPKKLPKGFDPGRIMELGKNPGLGLRALHARGFDGRGVGIAIIDQALLVDHEEYKDRLRLYEEIHCIKGGMAEMHAPAVASIAVGKSVGVAPGADLYHIACAVGDYSPGGEFTYDLRYLARAIDRIAEVNRSLGTGKKIRVISISLGINPEMANFDMADKAIERAEKEGIVTLYVGCENFSGAGRDPLADPELPGSYRSGLFWRKSATRMGATRMSARILLPMDSRCLASPTGKGDYVYYADGGLSWAVPYLAGLYALACQRRADIGFDEFWNALKANAIPVKEGKAIIGKMADPAGTLAALSYRVSGTGLAVALQMRSRDRAGQRLAQPFSSPSPFQDLRFCAYTGKEAVSDAAMAGLTFNALTDFGQIGKAAAERFLALGSVPGLGVKALHSAGITGKGVAVAIIDQNLSGGHPEFAERLVRYEDLGCGKAPDEGSMHGPAVASLLVGKNLGTAPGASLYFFAAPSWSGDAAYYARALERVVEINKRLGGREKIRVVSVSAAPSGAGSPFTANGGLWDAAMGMAEKAGILVLDCTQENGFILPGYCDIAAPDDFGKFTLGFPDAPITGRGMSGVYVPASRRTVAEEYFKGEFSYAYYGVGGLSWGIPFAAGICALAWQVNPRISAQGMRELIRKAAYVNAQGARIIDPANAVKMAKGWK